MQGNRHPHMTTTDVGTSLSPPPPHLLPPLLLQSAGSNYPRGKMPSHPVQFLLKSVVVRGRGKLIKKITLGVRTAGVVNSSRCQGQIRRRPALNGRLRKKADNSNGRQCTVNGSTQRQMSAEMLAAEMLAAEMSGDGGESRGSGGAIAAEQINK